MQDVGKTEIRRKTSERRQRRRNRWRSVYAFFVLLLVLGVGVSLCMTLFFNIATIEIGGRSDTYTLEEVAQASGVHTGDNLMRLSTTDVESRIMSRLIFIERADVEKQFPDTLRIIITPSTAALNIIDDSGTLQVSLTGKILTATPEADPTLPAITGFETTVRDPGETITSADTTKNTIFEEIANKLTDNLTYPITAVDMTDKYDITLTLEDRIIFSIGNWSELDYKISMAEAVLSNLDPDDEGYLTMIGDHQCAYRSKEAVEESAAVVTTIATDTSTPTATTTIAALAG